MLELPSGAVIGLGILCLHPSASVFLVHPFLNYFSSSQSTLSVFLQPPVSLSVTSLVSLSVSQSVSLLASQAVSLRECSLPMLFSSFVCLSDKEGERDFGLVRNSRVENICHWSKQIDSRAEKVILEDVNLESEGLVSGFQREERVWETYRKRMSRVYFRERCYFK